MLIIFMVIKFKVSLIIAFTVFRCNVCVNGSGDNGGSEPQKLDGLITVSLFECLSV